MTSPQESKITIRQAISKLQKDCGKYIADGDRDIIHLMEHIAELNETGIYKYLDKELTKDQTKRLNKAISRLKKDEPIEYVTGISHFYGNRFSVNKNTLIPRVETETLVDLARSIISEKTYQPYSKAEKLNIVDVGTGTGCIIISLALATKEPANYYATDISPEALKIARENTETYKLKSKITIKKGNLLNPISSRIKFDLVVANLPYIPENDLPILAKSVEKYEPKIALDGGHNGASLIRELLIQAQPRLRQNASLILEIQPKLVETVMDFAERFYPKSKRYIAKDTSEMDRFLVIQKLS
ncbi:peptide chain release factor N(5)-glutamine methyltransferase [Candidatus Dojkabacteria bacterium]|nr:peptide chain release factor N(5)-glutamine methyltransferase [Candidatus Dojkabacteria bacterium]